ncbi:MAG: cell division protein FtsZ [Proteobacteria bacterium]|nr:cell division protein FtsZ [Pseudomonadota bacterium]
MTINLTIPPTPEHHELKPRITVIGVGGAGGNAVNNMIESGLEGVEFLVVNSDAQALAHSKAERKLQMGLTITRGLGAGSNPDVGSAAAEESLQDVMQELTDCNMVFITAGLGGGSGTGGAPVIARAAREAGILTVGVVTKPFQFEGARRMKIAEAGLEELQRYVDTLLIIPNQNLFRVANENTTFADAFKMADDVLYSGVRGVTDLMVMPGLINLDFADIRSVMGEMGKAMMGTGEAEGERRAVEAAEAAIANPLLDDTSMAGARGVLINITAGKDITLFEVDEAANRIRDEVDSEANIIFGSTFDEALEGKVRVSVVATGIESIAGIRPEPIIRQVTVARAEAIPATPEPAAEMEPMVAAPVAQLHETPVEAPAAVASVENIVENEVIEAEEPMKVAVGGGMRTPEPISASVAGSSDDAFIPPAPAQATMSSNPPARANPFAVADMVNGGGEVQAAEPAPAPAPKPSLSLFERVTGVTRADNRPPAAETPRPQVATPQVSETPAPQPAPQPVAQPAPEVVAESVPEPVSQPEAPLLGAVDPSDRLDAPREDDDLLDIPAFLRRQAN